MAYLEINPRYRVWFRRQGWFTPETFLAWPGEVCSGHPDRHVRRVELPRESRLVSAYLKREHRVPWRDRLTHAWRGAGFVSKSLYEGRLLQAARTAGIACPEFLAAGEDDLGRAFLLVRALTGYVDLRLFLDSYRLITEGARRRFSRRLGQTLARLHERGFAHGDLYAKHVLVEHETQHVAFIDWQRAVEKREVNWAERIRDLAALDATLAQAWVSDRERCLCLRVYLRECVGFVTDREHQHIQGRIRQRTERLLHKRRIREQRQAPLADGAQNLIWLDGESLCVTPEFWMRCDGQLPPWLAPADMRDAVERRRVSLPQGGQGTLIRRATRRPSHYFRSWFRRRSESPELQQGALLFRLERQRIAVPRLLAVGQGERSPGCLESFVLTEQPSCFVTARAWLSGETPDQSLETRWRLLCEVGRLYRRLHDAGCLGATLDRHVGVRALSVGHWEIALGDIEGIVRHRRVAPHQLHAELATLEAGAGSAALSRTDKVRFLLGYFDKQRLERSDWPMISRSVSGATAVRQR